MKKQKKRGGKKTKADEDTKEESVDANATKVLEDGVERAEPGEEKAEEDNPEDKTSAIEDDKVEEASPSSTPSLAQQSKMRSTSFRVGTGPASPGPFSPDGETAPEIYRKQVTRIEELEKDNKRLAREMAEAEKRWQKAEEELADLREAEGERKGGSDETAQLVNRALLLFLHDTNHSHFRRAKSPH